MSHVALTPEQITLADAIEARLSKLITGRMPSRKSVERALAVVMPAIEQLVAITGEAAFDALLDRCPLMDSFMKFMVFMEDTTFEDELFDIPGDDDRSLWEAR
ncbi:MAG: hypothetical protein AAAC48_07580 [Phyllobacterium sp.]|jgi:hypothetical protein|uniref:hypothetical protein n=1 Tax=Phyllobacterium sp. TaxID=1871046 RepID=UPI0030F0FB04